MMSSLRSVVFPPPKPSIVSARPSSCRPPVSGWSPQRPPMRRQSRPVRRARARDEDDAFDYADDAADHWKDARRLAEIGRARAPRRGRRGSLVRKAKAGPRSSTSGEFSIVRSSAVISPSAWLAQDSPRGYKNLVARAKERRVRSRMRASETGLPFDDIRALVATMPGPDEDAVAGVGRATQFSPNLPARSAGSRRLRPGWPLGKAALRRRSTGRSSRFLPAIMVSSPMAFRPIRRP